MDLQAKIPGGPIDQKWDKHRFEMKLVNPANKRKYHVIVVGSGLAGASAAAFYILAMGCLGLHMWHGVWSLTQTLGLSHPRYNALRRAFATAITAAVVVGNISFPVAVLTGIVREAPRVAQAGAQAPGSR